MSRIRSTSPAVLRVMALVVLLLLGFGAELPAAGVPAAGAPAGGGSGSEIPAFFAGHTDAFGHGPYGPLRIEPPERRLLFAQTVDGTPGLGPDPRSISLKVDLSPGANPVSPSLYLRLCSFLC